jgi:hypothetical protein
LASSKTEFGFKLGLATGDKGDDPNRDYAFHYNRNYKIAMLLFNEDLGVAGDSVHGSQGIGPILIIRVLYFLPLALNGCS